MLWLAAVAVIAQQVPGDRAGDSAEAVIAAARVAVADGNNVDFSASETITRYTSQDRGRNWKAADVVTADVKSVKRKDVYRNIRVNGKLTKRPGATGAWSQGEFHAQLEELFSPATSAVFNLAGHEALAGRMVWRVEYSVDGKHSKLHLLSNGVKYTPAYNGTVWIDRETSRVLRMEMKADTLPLDFPLATVESSLEYGFVTIDGNSFLLPVRGEAQQCAGMSSWCARNVIEFRDHRKL